MQERSEMQQRQGYQAVEKLRETLDDSICGRLFYSMQVRVSKPIQGFRSLMK